MKIKFILLCFLFLGFLKLYSQQGVVRNQSVRISEEQDKVTIMYDLISSGSVSDYFSIQVEIRLDGVKLDPRGLSGDIGNLVSPGLGRKIVWDVYTDIAELSGELAIRVYVDKPAQSTGLPCPISAAPAYRGLVSLVGTGSTSILWGIRQYNKAYSWYTEEYQPNPVVSMDEFDKYEKNFRVNSKIFIGAGAGIVAVGVISFINKITKINKYNRACTGIGSTLQKPRFEVRPILTGSVISAPGLGIALTFN
jgi:hypothetical protein